MCRKLNHNCGWHMLALDLDLSQNMVPLDPVVYQHVFNNHTYAILRATPFTDTSPLYPQGYPLVCLQPLPKTQVQDEENPKEDARVPVWLLRSNVILNNRHEDLESTTDLG